MKAIFSRFFVVLAAKSHPKSSLLENVFKNVDFLKILTKHWLCAQKSRFELKKNQKNSEKIDSKTPPKKRTQKKSKKLVLAPILGFKPPPKSKKNL